MDDCHTLVTSQNYNPKKNIDLHVFECIGMKYIANPSVNRTLTIELDCEKIILSLKLISNDKNY